MSIIRVSRDGYYFVEYGNGVRYHKRDKPELSEYFQKIEQPIAVIGGGSTAMQDLKGLPGDCLYYAVNFHFLEKGLFDFTYLSFLDRPSMGRNAVKKMKLYKEFNGVRITNQIEYTDINIVKEEPLICGDTGIFALWIALYLTTGKVYVCGMDNRTGAKMHSNESHVYEQTKDTKIEGPRNFFRWKRLFLEGYKPERLQIQNEAISNYLRSEKFTFNEG